MPEIDIAVEDVTGGGLVEAYQVLEERTLAASASSHDDKDVRAIDGEGKLPLNQEIAVAHFEALYADMGLSGFGVDVGICDHRATRHT